jgi:hypothetical protein
MQRRAVGGIESVRGSVILPAKLIFEKPVALVDYVFKVRGEPLSEYGTTYPPTVLRRMADKI